MGFDVKTAITCCEEAFYGEGVSDCVIQKAEQLLDLCFAADYREYLRCFGIAAVHGHELNGLECSDYVDVCKETQEFRQKDCAVPKDWYVIENTHIDDLYALQDASGTVYLKRLGAKNYITYDSLIAYLDL